MERLKVGHDSKRSDGRDAPTANKACGGRRRQRREESRTDPSEPSDSVDRLMSVTNPDIRLELLGSAPIDSWIALSDDGRKIA